MIAPTEYQNSQSQPFVPDFNRKSKIESDFKVLKKYEDSRFGPVTIIEVPGNSKKLMVREKTFNNKNEIVAEINAAHRRLSIGDNHLLAFVDYSTGSRSDFCSSVYWIKLFFEFPDHDIDSELRRRTRDNLQGLNSSELTHLLYQTIHAGAVLNRSQLYHGDICPQTIEMDSPEFYKLVERFGDLTQPEEFQQTRIMGGGEVYSAPEIYSRIKKGKGKTSIKGTLPAKSMMTADIFNLGMTVLHAGTDEGVQSVYNPDGSMNLEVLEKLKSQFARKYPENNLLVTTIYAMLEQDPARRPPDFITMESELPPYSVIMEALEFERRNSQQGYRPQAAGPQGYPQGSQQAYTQYVNKAAWEQNWTPQSQASRPQPQSYSPLASNLNLPKPSAQSYAPVQQTTTAAPQQQAQHHFGVVPPMGQGVPGYQPAPQQLTATIPQTIAGQGSPLKQAIGAQTAQAYPQAAGGQITRPATFTQPAQSYGATSQPSRPIGYSQSGLIQPGAPSQPLTGVPQPSTGVHSASNAYSPAQGLSARPVASYVQGQQGQYGAPQGGLGQR
jgi:hypothetical protein